MKRIFTLVVVLLIALMPPAMAAEPIATDTTDTLPPIPEVTPFEFPKDQPSNMIPLSCGNEGSTSGSSLSGIRVGCNGNGEYFSESDGSVAIASIPGSGPVSTPESDHEPGPQNQSTTDAPEMPVYLEQTTLHGDTFTDSTATGATLYTSTQPSNIRNINVESEHPYANNFEYTWEISQPDADQICLHFDKLELANYDYLEIHNDLGKYLGSYGKTHNGENFWTEWYATDTLRLKLVTDDSRTAYGFLVDQIYYRNEKVPPTEHLAESHHPYANCYEYTWEISQPGADQICLHFDKLELANYDYLEIHNDLGKYLGSYGRTHNGKDFWTEWYATDTLRLKLVTDDSRTAYGFLVDQIYHRNEKVPPTEYFAESHHPYANCFEYIWEISQPGADQIRLHFDKLELENYDYLEIYNDLGKRLKYYGKTHNSKDFWTEWYTTDTLRLKLATDDSRTAYGFLMDYIETDKGIIYPPEPTQSKLRTDPATDITDTGATLHGHLTNGKPGETYDVCFRYHEVDGGKTKVGYATVSTTNPGYEYRLTGLKPGTTYHYRAVHRDSQDTLNPNPIDATEYQIFMTSHSIPSGLKIDSVVPGSVTNTGRSTLTITGSGFSPDTTVQLQHAKYDQHIIQSDERFESESRIRATVNLDDVSEGYWNLIVENSDGQKQVKSTAIFVSRPVEKPQKEDPSITLTGSQKLWIDPLSEGDRQTTIRYLITPADYSGKVIMEVSDATGKKVGEVTKTVTSGGTGSLTWDGKINSRLVNPAKNPYTVRLRLGGSAGSDLTGAVSKSQQVFVGRPVLFVHGINALAKDIDTNPGFQAFSESHYTVAVEYADSKFKTFSGNIPQFSRRLDQEITQIKRDTGAKKVDIVAHSMGGLVSRYYIEKMGGRDDVGKLIMVQTPNHGSEWVDLRILAEYVGDVKDIKSVHKLLSKYGIAVKANDIIEEFFPSLCDLLMEVGLELYDTTAAGQMAPYNKFLVGLNGNELPYASDYYMKKGLVQDKIQDPSGYVVIASQNFPTPSHSFITVKNPFTKKTMINKRIPGATKGDSIVSYNSAKLTVAPIVKVEEFHILLPWKNHINPWEKESVVNYLAEFLSSADDYPQLTVKTCSDDWLTSFEFQEEENESPESGFWSDWITTNISKAEDLNLTFTIEPLTTSAQFLFLWDEGALSLSFTAPNGTVTDTITSEIQCEYSIDAAPGIWNVTIHPVSMPDDTVEVSAASYQTNPVVFELLPEVEETKPGDALPVSIYYGSDNEPCTEATVTATVMKPDKSLISLTLYDTAGDGIYSNTFTDTTMPGTYLISASGSWTIDDVTLSRTTRKYTVLMEYPDLAIDEIVVTPQDLHAGEEIDITATISNCGSADATNVSVTVYADLNSFRYNIDNRAFDIPVGGSATFTTRWKARADLHTIIALVDSCDEVIEESYSNNIGNATVRVQPSRMGLESANITICEGEIGLIPIILTNCTDLQHIVGTFAFNNSVVEFVNASSTASSIEYENTTGLVRLNITYDEETAGDTSVADIVMRGIGAPGEGTETKIVIDVFDGLGLHGATMTGSNQINLIKNITDYPELHADFTANTTSGPIPLAVQFADASTGNPTAWSWNFGDGNTSTKQHPVHTYTAAGNHTVSLSVEGEGGTCIKSGYIKVTPILFGDADGDGRVNQADTLLVLQQVVELKPKPDAGTERFRKIDVNQNGVIDVGDALFIAQHNVDLRDVWFELL